MSCPTCHSNIPLTCGNKPMDAGNSCYPFVKQWQGIAYVRQLNPHVYQKKCYNDAKQYMPSCNKTSYGSRVFTEPRKMVEGFDFAHSVNDFTPLHCKYNANGTLKCSPKTVVLLRKY